jgi:hypothetical protein
MSTPRSEVKESLRTCAGCLIAILACTAFLGFWLHREINPPDRVLVSISDIDPSMEDYYLVADTPAGTKNMPWYSVKVTPFTRKSGGFASHHFSKDSDTLREAFVAWIRGERYGVVIGCKDEDWRVFWFRPEDVHLRWDSWIVGGGEASIQLADKEKGELYRDSE